MPHFHLSPENRQRALDQMAGGEELDILVIGGGVTGAGIALDAATRGLDVGIVEARDAAGTWFGEPRLGEFLRRAIAGGQPAAETVRRLTSAVLAHQGGLLQDDASVLLARWKQP